MVLWNWSSSHSRVDLVEVEAEAVPEADKGAGQARAVHVNLLYSSRSRSILALSSDACRGRRHACGPPRPLALHLSGAVACSGRKGAVACLSVQLRHLLLLSRLALQLGRVGLQRQQAEASSERWWRRRRKGGVEVRWATAVWVAAAQ